MIAEMLSLKGIVGITGRALGGVSFGALGFVIGENLSGNLWVAIIISALCQVIFGWLTNRPRMVTASSHADIAARQQSMSEWTSLLQTQQEIANEQAKIHRKQIENKESVVALMRMSNNNAMDALGMAYRHITLLESILKDGKLTIPPFKQRTVKEITATEDAEILKIVGNGNGK